MKQITTLRGSASLAAMALMGLAGVAQAQTQAPASAPDAAQDNGDTIVVVGVRKALETAQTIKRDSDTVVDSITATDIGAFPDTSVSGALQRVPGITTSRMQSTDDSTHPPLGRAHRRAHPRPHLRAHRVQRARQLLGRQLSRPQLQRHLARADVGCRRVQEPDGGDDRGRSGRHGQPAHAPAVRSEGPRRRRQRQGDLWRSLGRTGPGSSPA
jgi:hypothetical protein